MNKSEYKSNLKTILSPYYFPVLTSHGLSTEEMALITGLTKGSVNRYRSDLIKAGIDTKKEWIRKTPATEEVFSFLKKPSTCEEISNGLRKSKTVIYSFIRILKEKGKVRTYKMKIGRGNIKRNFHSDELVGELLRKALFYRIGEEKKLGEEITEYFPNKLTRSMRKSLTQKLKNQVRRGELPEEAYKIVYEYMCEHAVK